MIRVFMQESHPQSVTGVKIFGLIPIELMANYVKIVFLQMHHILFALKINNI